MDRQPSRIRGLIRATIRNVSIGPMSIVERIQVGNQNGRYYLFAPNHIKPQARILLALRLTLDLFVVADELHRLGVDCVGTGTGDYSFRIGSSRCRQITMSLNRWLYRQLLTIGIPDSIQFHANHIENASSTILNVKSIRNIVKTLYKNNVIIFPYGRAYPSGEQHFLEAESFHNSSFIPFSIEPELDFEQWRRGIKPGAFWLAQQTGCEIVPIYMDSFDGRWRLGLGQPIDVTSAPRSAERRHCMLQAARAYVAQMEKLRTAAQPIIRSW